MADRKLIEEVGKYIDRYYEPARDDIKIDKEMLSVFEKITRLRECRNCLIISLGEVPSII